MKRIGISVLLYQGPARSMSARYLYAIITDAAAGDVLAGLGETGIGDTKVETLAADGIAAVVSAYQDASVRPQRTNIAAHQRVLSTLLAVTTLLPISFGTPRRGRPGHPYCPPPQPCGSQGGAGTGPG